MKIVLITTLTPTRDNFRGPSALHYHLIKCRPADVDVTIYTLNGNSYDQFKISDISKELNAKIIVVKKTLRNFFQSKHKLADLRIKLGLSKYYGISNYELTKSYLNEIDEINPDFVWIYDEALISIANQLKHHKLLICGCDCFPLRSIRFFNDPYTFNTPGFFEKKLQEYKVTVSRELAYKDIPCKLFNVGIDDLNYYRVITNSDRARFIPHPHYDVVEKQISFHKEKLSILISGQLVWTIYTQAMALQRELNKQVLNLKDKFKIVILGKKFEDYADNFIKAGWDVELKTWVDIYSEEISKHDIQIFPFSVGSGTKGKVLDALSMGLLTIGTKYALENIYVKHNHSCLKYENAAEIPQLLLDIYNNKEVYQKIAENGRSQVLKWHNRERVSQLIFDYAMGNSSYDGVEEYNKVQDSLIPLI